MMLIPALFLGTLPIIIVIASDLITLEGGDWVLFIWGTLILALAGAVIGYAVKVELQERDYHG